MQPQIGYSGFSAVFSINKYFFMNELTIKDLITLQEPTKALFQRIEDTIKPVDYDIECSQEGYIHIICLVIKVAAALNIFFTYEEGYTWGLVQHRIKRLLDKKTFDEFIMRCISKLDLLSAFDYAPS